MTDDLNGPATRARETAQEQRSTTLFGSPYHLATMIAMSIGLHNLSEGLAIGQSYASGSIALAVVLIVGFGAHNATEGFGIAGPLTGMAKKPQVSFLKPSVALWAPKPTMRTTEIGRAHV